jgi:hypothetical protein
MKDFVNYNLALKLKEKDFKEKCLAYYDVEDNVGLLYNTQYSDDLCPCQYTDLLISYNSGDIVSNLDDSGNCIDAPTISQVLKWLREEKEIDILLQPIFLYNENNREREYGIEIYAPQLNKPTHLDYFKNWEKGAIAGIEYVLDNLI